MVRPLRLMWLLLVPALGAALSVPPGGAAAKTAPAPKPVSATGHNLLANPGFEEGLPGHAWMPAAWDTFESGLNTVFFGRDSFLVHGGQYAVSVANLSTQVPMFHNWSQTLIVGPEMWDKDMVFSIWTRSNGLDGRAYVLLQAYRDTIEQMALTWHVPRDTARVRLGYVPTSQPISLTGYKRLYFSDRETDWVQREVRARIAPGTNIVSVRGGIFGTGQVLLDDASLAVIPTVVPPPAPEHRNLLADPGFEGDGNAWDYSLPPFPGLKIERDTTVAHTGRASLHLHGGRAPFQARTGAVQVFDGRPFWGKRVKVSAWLRCDSLRNGAAYVKVFASTELGELQGPPAIQYGATMPWTPVSYELDIPPGTDIVSAWYMYDAPAMSGELWFDDCSLEVLGPAEYIKNKGKPPAIIPLPQPSIH
ncbi:MAG: hypothetical protein ACHQ52_01015 [Candidatus Eisenbacteria bacterium]